MFPISAVAQRYLKMMEAKSAATGDKVEDNEVANHQHSQEKSQVSLENSCVYTNHGFEADDKARNSFADETGADVIDTVFTGTDYKFNMFRTLEASKKPERQLHSYIDSVKSNQVKADATYTVVAEASEFGLSTDTAAIFGHSTVRENTNLFPAAGESDSESEEEFFAANGADGSVSEGNFSFAKANRDATAQVSTDQSLSFCQRTKPQQVLPLIRPLVKRRRVEPINAGLWDDNSVESKTGTEALFGSPKVVNLANQTSQSKIDCITIDASLSKVYSAFCDTVAKPPEEASMTEREASFDEDADAFLFELPIRVRDKTFEMCVMQKKKVHFNTYYEMPREVKPEPPDMTDFCCPETDDDFDAIVKEMMTLSYANVDQVDAIGDPNQSLTFGSDIGDDDISDMDLEDEECLKDQLLSSSTPTKKHPEASFSADAKITKKSFLQRVNDAGEEMSRPSPILSSFSVRPDDQGFVSGKQLTEKSLSQSVRKSPPKNKTLQPSHVDTESSQKPAGQEENLNHAVRQLHFSQSPHASAPDGQGVVDDFARHDFEKFLVHYAVEKAKPDLKNGFRGFTSQQQKSLEKFDQEVVKEALNGLIEDDTQTNEKNVEVIQKIEKVFMSLLEAMSEGKPMELKVPAVRKWKDCTMSQDVLTQRESTPVKTISHGNKGSERTFAVNVTVLSEVYKMLSKNMTCTKRELYYRDVDMFESQTSVNSAIDSICAMLDVQEFELGVLTSSKGLVAGDLVIRVGDDVTDCTNQCSVPQNPSAISSLESNADYVLVVEKDTVFQRLVSEKIFSRIDEKIILVTAKGYPDVNTRVFLKKIADDLKLPIYILVDADPHGIEIMLTYKYGSMTKIHNSQYLAVPSIQWIGFYPSDLVREDAMTLDLTEKDLKKIDELLERPYMNAFLKRELNCFKASLKKAEIESLYNFSINNLINDYIPRKIRSLETPLTQLWENVNKKSLFLE